MSDFTSSDEQKSGAVAGEPSLRTILILDLTDSSALVDRLGEQRAAELIRRHERLARDLLRRHRGREVDNIDGLLLLFERPVQAIAFALEYQRRLQELAALENAPISARIGIHVGDVVLWENSAEEVARGAKPMDVEGLARPCAAHLKALAGPGQTLLSAVAYSLAQHADVELREAGRAPQWKAHGPYQLQGVSGPTLVYEVGEVGVAPFRAPPSGARAQRILPWWQRPVAVASGISVALLALAALAYVALKPAPSIAFAERDWVVVGDMVNQTGQALLDDSLDLAFRQGLSQSRYVNVLSSLQVRDALTRMKLDADLTRINRSVGAELAQREGARALLLPSVTDTGGAFRLSIEVIDPHTQATVWIASEIARHPTELLPAMDALIDGLREHLGESMRAIGTDSAPLAQATTANLEALRIYSIGLREFNRSRYDDARRLFERAIELDPEFAMAYVGIASTYLPIGRWAEGVEPARRAAALRDRLSPREVLYVDALLATAEDPLRAVDRWRDFANIYPDAGSGQNNGALVLFQDLNRCPEAVPLFDQAFNSRDPKRAMSGHFKGYCELWSGDGQAAERSFRSSLQVNPRPTTQGLAHTFIYFERWDEADAALRMDRTDLPPPLALIADEARIVWFAYQGRLREARVAAQALEKTATNAGVPAMASRARIFDAALAQQAGEVVPLQEYADRERPLLDERQSPQYPVSLHLALLALIAERAGADQLARDWVTEIRTQPPQRPSPSLQALLKVLDARLNKSPQQGLEALAAGKDPHELMQVRVAAADLARLAGDPALELEHLRWIDSHRSRAFAESIGWFAALGLNVLDVNRALLRQAQIDLDQRAALTERLRQRWNKADQVLLQQLPPVAATEP